MMLTRWDEWYSTENLAKDERLLAAPPSRCAVQAAQFLAARGNRQILDLACGIGRDTLYLENLGFRVIGADASFNGLSAAQRRGVRSPLVATDARCLPFANGTFEGVYCFGLLHEFTSEGKALDVAKVMGEIRRVLCSGGVLVLTVVSGDPEAGLPHVQCFSREIFEQATQDFRSLEISEYDDTGCTGRTDYRVWYGLFER